ncbi:bacterioferritin-associated ferredoxin [Marinimicrobium alkaliphilum]|uniref:bacterioferritin-associated ferredoxin n=1 Tax=Marinimicrobium alkaliphilum TaxID=2202654 RepID=UPI000DBA3AAC|nr:bacterioferritin-associated ferredoxin [Marinimicrobium alkaliphilum]
MYVCLCKGITDRQVEAAIDEGATTLGKLRKALGVASQCGKCGVTTREILTGCLAATPDKSPAPFYAAA